jgi:hypothetical protein
MRTAEGCTSGVANYRFGSRTLGGKFCDSHALIKYSPPPYQLLKFALEQASEGPEGGGLEV